MLSALVGFSKLTEETMFSLHNFTVSFCVCVSVLVLSIEPVELEPRAHASGFFHPQQQK